MLGGQVVAAAMIDRIASPQRPGQHNAGDLLRNRTCPSPPAENLPDDTTRPGTPERLSLPLMTRAQMTASGDVRCVRQSGVRPSVSVSLSQMATATG